ncbi:MAG TPA: pyridoxamine 5'-phosphate oxidase [Candidatus Binatia bacterium]|nr:pyridoxamine 5'-phosphate oxidase [Candidatus Binatia bacterium]
MANKRSAKRQRRVGGAASTSDPLARFRRWYAAAARAGTAQPDAMALATAERGGAPSVRFVLLKQADPRGFVFFTDVRSRKGRELRENARAALAFHWGAIGRQVRIEGRVREVSADEADAYWRTRPRESQLAASSSFQSAPLASRAVLVRRWRDLARSLAGRDVPRPPSWTGFRIAPQRIEFWTHRDHRLHDRELFTRTAGGGWRRSRLHP